MSAARGNSLAGTDKVLAVPGRTRQAPDHGSNRSRTGKSPLARRSFVRSASDSLEMAAVQGDQAIEMREQGAGLMDPRARSISPQGPHASSVQASAPTAAPADESQPPPLEGKSKKERKKLSKTRPGSSGSGK